MTLEQIQKSLQQMTLFQTLSEESLKLVASKLESKSFPAGETIVRKGDVGDCLFIIHSGKVKVLTELEGEELILAYLESGNHFGEMALLTGDLRSATVVSEKESMLLILYKMDFDELLHREPSLFFRFSRILSERLRDLNQKILDAIKKKQKGAPGLTGKIGTELKISDLLRFCESNALTGILSITNRSRSSVLEYDKGRLDHIRLGEKEEAAAMDELLSWPEGVYIIQPRIFSIAAQELNGRQGNLAGASSAITTDLQFLLKTLNCIANYYRGILGNTAVSNIFRRSQLVLIVDHSFLGYFVVYKEGTLGILKNSSEKAGSEEIKSIALWCAFVFENCMSLAIGLYPISIEQITQLLETQLKPLGFYDYFYEYQKTIPKSDFLVYESFRL